MSYCPNPHCHHRQNSDDAESCQNCGTPLFVQNRYRLVKPMRSLNPNHPTEVFEVEDWQNWGASKVLKVLRYVKNPDLVKRFQQEAHILQILNTYDQKEENIGVPKVEPEGVFAIDLNAEQPKVYGLVMEKIPGDNLEHIVAERDTIAAEQYLSWLREIVNILHFLHQHNFLHRDIKPSNLICQPNGEIALIDFGIVGTASLAETQIGSLGYAAPEQIAGEKVTPSSDFFALGRTFVHLLTGRHPLDFATDPKTRRLLWRDSIRSPIPRSLADLIDELMHPNRDKRPRDTQQVKKKLDELERKLERQTREQVNFAILPSLPLCSLCPLWFKNTKVTCSRPTQYPALPFKKVFALFAVLSVLLGFLPTINRYIVNRLDRDLVSFGTAQEASHPERARFYWNLALFLNPNNAAAHWSLGDRCEVRQNYLCAKEKYQQTLAAFERQRAARAPQNDDSLMAIEALTNLSRLEILDDNLQQAKAYLERGFTLIPTAANNPVWGESWKSEIQRLGASLAQNRGWLALSEGQYEVAQTFLETAVAIQEQAGIRTPDPYCRLAQVFEATSAEASQIRKAWSECLTRPASDKKPEIIELKRTARRYLERVGGLPENLNEHGRDRGIRQ